ncbi:MAG: IS3 family transposase [Clostridia bacterium]
MKLTNDQKKTIAARYHKGETATIILTDYDISRSTFYRIVNEYKPLQPTSREIISKKEHLNLLRTLEKQSKALELIKLSGFTPHMTLEEKLDLYYKFEGQYSTNLLLETFNISKGTYHNLILKKNEPTFYNKKKAMLIPLIKEIFDESEQRFGANKIYGVLKERGISTSKKYVLKLMKEIGIESIVTSSKKVYKSLQPKSNVLKRKFNPNAPNEVWASDITYFKVNNYYLYTCVIMDLYSRKIIAYNISHNQSTKLVSKTFKQAYELRQPNTGLIFHSDRGAQYTSSSFSVLLHKLGVEQSFSQAGVPHDNAVVEAFFKILKVEELYRRYYTSEKDFHHSVANFMEYYNNKRTHKHTGYKSPNTYEKIYETKRFK